MNRTCEAWIAWGKQQNRQLYFYEEKVFDLSSFCFIHPGGKKALANYVYKDITKIIFTVYPHPSRCIETLGKYYIGTNSTYEAKSAKNDKSISKSSIKNSQQKKKVCFRKTIHYNEDKKQNPFKNVDSSQNQKSSSGKQLSDPGKQKGNKKSKSKSKFHKKPGDLVIEDTSCSETSSLNIQETTSRREQEWTRLTDQQQFEENTKPISVPFFQVKNRNQLE